jgi:hypothetical protein
MLILVLFTVGSLYTATAQQDWQLVNIDERFTVKMPGQPEKKDMEGLNLFQYAGTDSSSYVVTVVDLANYGVDSAMLQSMVGTEMFMEQFKSGITSQSEGTQIVSSTTGKLDDYTTYTFELDVPVKSRDTKVRAYSYTVFVGSRAYSMNYVDAKGVNAGKEPFFGSVKVR